MRRPAWLLLVGILGLVGCGSAQPASQGYGAADFAKRPPPAGFSAAHAGAGAPKTSAPPK